MESQATEREADGRGDASRAERVLAWLRDRLPEMEALLSRLVAIETPSHDVRAQDPLFECLGAELGELDFCAMRLRGRATGGALYARPARRRQGAPIQLLLGHGDTVWPRHTLAERGISVEDRRMHGPGVYDMKAGLVQLLFALRVLRELGIESEVTPIVLVNADEEIGSRDSTRHVVRLARVSDRVFVMEPSLGLEGRLKTARKGVGRFTVTVRGRSAHAGLDPGEGVSAILELSHVIQKLFELNDVERGVTVNVGTIDGGMGANVVAPESRAVVDVRVLTPEDAGRVEAAIRGLAPSTPGATLEIEGRIGRPPMQRTTGTGELFQRARTAADELGFSLDEATAGGGSDGNTTGIWAPTLDGLGAVGDGAHATHEFVFLDRMAERAALLALLVAAPPLAPAAPEAIA